MKSKKKRRDWGKAGRWAGRSDEETDLAPAFERGTAGELLCVLTVKLFVAAGLRVETVILVEPIEPVVEEDRGWHVALDQDVEHEPALVGVCGAALGRAVVVAHRLLNDVLRGQNKNADANGERGERDCQERDDHAAGGADRVPGAHGLLVQRTLLIRLIRAAGGARGRIRGRRGVGIRRVEELGVAAAAGGGDRLGTAAGGGHCAGTLGTTGALRDGALGVGHAFQRWSGVKSRKPRVRAFSVH
jgi:hypothetical protein